MSTESKTTQAAAKLTHKFASSPVGRAFVLSSSSMLVKMVLMSPIISAKRLLVGAGCAPEDERAGLGLKMRTDDEVERLRRAHLNDIENIVPFVLLGAMYVRTRPSPCTAFWVFRLFVLGRLLHTVSYVFLKNSTLRALGFAVGVFCNLFMGFKVIAYAGCSGCHGKCSAVSK